MKKFKLFLLFPVLLFGLSSCGGNKESTIKVSASEKPHAEILRNAVAPVLEKEGYKLEVTVLDWTIQNDEVNLGSYDANYFQHKPFLDKYTNGKLVPAASVHYENLCIYDSGKETKKIHLVDDLSNLKRALDLLKQENIITSYKEPISIANINKDVVKAPGYEDYEFKCMEESSLANAFYDAKYTIMSGSTALTANIGKDQVFKTEYSSQETIDLFSNLVVVKEENLNSPKTKALVKAFNDPSVKEYIANTYGDIITFNYKSFIE